jgi:AcrR family transcriptional regulator
MKTERRPYRQTARAETAVATRERILDAATEHFLARYYDEVTLAGIGRDAGVTQQTVINHFTSKEGLLQAAADRLDPERFRRELIDDPVAGVVGDYEASGDAMIRMLAIEDRVPALAQFLARGRAGHRAWVVEAFAGQLPAGPRPVREQMIDALVVATDLYTWKRLRRDIGLSRAKTIAAMQLIVTALAHEA